MTKYPQTYQLIAEGGSIICLICGNVSHNAIDVSERYCGHCHVFHEDEQSVSQVLDVESPAIATARKDAAGLSFMAPASKDLADSSLPRTADGGITSLRIGRFFYFVFLGATPCL